MMTIHCNGDALEVPLYCTLYVALENYLTLADSVAVAVNQTVIPKSQWHEYRLKDDDCIDVFTLVAGG